jgi:hypothetical protein
MFSPVSHTMRRSNVDNQGRSRCGHDLSRSLRTHQSGVLSFVRIFLIRSTGPKQIERSVRRFASRDTRVKLRLQPLAAIARDCVIGATVVCLLIVRLIPT